MTIATVPPPTMVLRGLCGGPYGKIRLYQRPVWFPLRIGLLESGPLFSPRRRGIRSATIRAVITLVITPSIVPYNPSSSRRNQYVRIAQNDQAGSSLKLFFQLLRYNIN